MNDVALDFRSWIRVCLQPDESNALWFRELLVGENGASPARMFLHINTSAKACTVDDPKIEDEQTMRKPMMKMKPKMGLKIHVTYMQQPPSFS